MPSASNSLMRSALPDADNPRTLIKAAIPIVMPSAERAEQSPCSESRTPDSQRFQKAQTAFGQFHLDFGAFSHGHFQAQCSNRIQYARPST